MLCWGSTKHGQLGLGGIEEEIIRSPQNNKHFSSKRVIQIACGYNHTLFLVDDGTVYSCGNNDFEQLGHDGPRKRPEPVTLLETQFITRVAAGHSFSLALNKSGSLFCWGALLGDVERREFTYSKPTMIKIDSPVIQVSKSFIYDLLVVSKRYLLLLPYFIT